MIVGTVIEFDAHVGLGKVRDDVGREFMFHCAEIIDGSRVIDVGARVSFHVVTKFGREEATAITPG